MYYSWAALCSPYGFINIICVFSFFWLNIYGCFCFNSYNFCLCSQEALQVSLLQRLDNIIFLGSQYLCLHKRKQKITISRICKENHIHVVHAL